MLNFLYANNLMPGKQRNFTSLFTTYHMLNLFNVNDLMPLNMEKNKIHIVLNLFNANNSGKGKRI